MRPIDKNNKFTNDQFILLIWFIIFITILIISLMLFPVDGVTCRDGSTSYAIGRRGACSHHGGVSGSTFVFNIIGSFILSVICIYKIHHKISLEKTVGFYNKTVIKIKAINQARLDSLIAIDNILSKVNDSYVKATIIIVSVSILIYLYRIGHFKF